MGIVEWFKKKSAGRAEPEKVEAAEPEPASQTEEGEEGVELPALPSCNDLFVRFFEHRYSDDERRRHGRNGVVRPDVERCAAPGTPTSELSPLTPESGRKVIEFLRGLAGAASGAPGTIDLAWIHGFDAFYDRNEIARMLEASDPADRTNRYAMTCLGFAAALGEVLIASMPGCEWLPSAPPWESAVYDPRGGYRINVFDWAVKKLSDYGVDDGYAMKIKVCVGMYEEGWRSLEER
jgi:hypothetical protein